MGAAASAFERFKNASKRQGRLLNAPSKLAKDACQTFRGMLASWPLRSLHCLLVEFEASLALRELTALSDLARPRAPSLSMDMAKLFNESICWDVSVRFNGKLYCLHRCIVQCRSVWLANILNSNSGNGPIDLQLPNTTHDLITSFLLFLYTGTLDNKSFSQEENDKMDVLKSLFGLSDNWVADMATLCRNAQEGDLELIFTRCVDDDASLQSFNETFYETLDESLSKWRLHAAVLAARSSYFRSLIEKRRKARPLNQPIRIYFDESVIPRQYAPVIFKAMYRDYVDLSMIEEESKCPRHSSLNEVKAVTDENSLAPHLEQATEIYQVARFLEYPILIHGCEDAIACRINFDTLHALYNWSQQPYGSCYVRRCCVAFLAEHFEHAISRPDFVYFEESLLIDSLKLDFVQATELEILAAVLKWGEYQLMRSFEEREPNVVAGTTHSVRRKGLRKCAETDAELRQILVNLLPLIRLDYILPRNHQIFSDALANNLVELDASFENCNSKRCANDASAACSPLWSWDFVVTRPRIYLPFYAMAKRAFAKRIGVCPEEANSLIEHRPLSASERLSSAKDAGVDLINSCRCLPTVANLFVAKNLSYKVERQVMDVLVHEPVAQRAINCGCVYHLRAALEQVKLRVLRSENENQVNNQWRPARLDE